MSSHQCRPLYSPFDSDEEYIKHRLNEEMAFSIMMTTTSFILCLILLAIMIYSVYKCVVLFREHLRKKKDAKNHELKAFIESKEKSRTLVSRFDNNDNVSTLPNTMSYASMNSDRAKFSKNINEKVEKYRHFNKNINRYFQRNFDKNAPEKIDDRILLQEHDNW